MKASVAHYICFLHLTLEAIIDIASPSTRPRSASHGPRFFRRHHIGYCCYTASPIYTLSGITTSSYTPLPNCQQRHPKRFWPFTAYNNPHVWSDRPPILFDKPIRHFDRAVLSFSTAFCTIFEVQTGYLAVSSIYSRILVAPHYWRDFASCLIPQRG